MNVELITRLEAELAHVEESVRQMRNRDHRGVSASELAAEASNLAFHEGQVSILSRIIGQHNSNRVPPLVADYLGFSALSAS